jgi:hypothetical protein
LNRKLTPHSMINGNASFAYFNKNWGIPWGLAWANTIKSNSKADILL